ncbi:MAG: twin-arginine translocase subunit TatC [Planctomycetes bacterium]|nr:twin-arginine translocase subunit TatC [Planctomycetota bacterium]
MVSDRDRQKEEDERMRSSRMSFGDHLEELRKRVLWSLIVLGVCMFAAFFVYEPLLQFFIQPYKEIAEAENAAAGKEILGPLKTIGVTEGFFAAMKAAFLVALAVGGPFVVYQAWQFIAAGLYTHERKAVLYYLPLSMTLFAGGLAFGYLMVVPSALRFLLTFLKDDFVQSELTLTNYMSFLIVMSVILGIVFQIPMVMLFLARTGMVEPAWFAKQRRMFIFLAVVASALLTPTPDPFTLMLVAVPMILLFELGLLLARFAYRKRAAVAELV